MFISYGIYLCIKHEKQIGVRGIKSSVLNILGLRCLLEERSGFRDIYQSHSYIEDI